MLHLIMVLFCSLAVGLAGSTWAGVGVITHLSGVLTVKRASGESKILAAKSEVEEGDLLVTQDKTFARIKFVDGGNLVLRPNTELRIDRYSYKQDKPDDDNVAISLVKGGLRAVTGAVGKRNRERHTTTTANATIGIRGTSWGVQVCLPGTSCGSDGSGKPLRPGTHTDVLSGEIEMRNKHGAVRIRAGQFGMAPADQSRPPFRVPPSRGSRVMISPSMVTDTGDGDSLGEGGDNACAIK